MLCRKPELLRKGPQASLSDTLAQLSLSGLSHAVVRPQFSSDPRGFFPSKLAVLLTKSGQEPLFGDGKEELGLDHYQLMSAQALLRFWTLAMLAYVFLEEEQHRLRVTWQRPVTIGEARREIQRRHRHCLLEWLHEQFLSGVHPEMLFDLFAA